MIGLRFVLLTLLVPVLGSSMRNVAAVRALPASARYAVYFAAGLVTLVLEMWLLSVIGVRWSLLLLIPVPLALGAWSFVRSSRTSGRAAAGRPYRASPILLVAVFGVGVLAATLLAGAATSGDFAFFWGVKGQKFGTARMIDTDFLRDPHHSFISHPDYPPLLPLYYAWTMLGAERLDWFGAVVSPAIFLLLAVAAVSGFGQHAGLANADRLAALLGSILAYLFIRNLIGAIGEPPLLFFETVALAALIGWRNHSGENDLVAAISLTGAVLTKVEGGPYVAVVLACSWLARQGTLRERLVAGLKVAILPMTALLSWLAFSKSRGLLEAYLTRERLSAEYVIPAVPLVAKAMSFGVGYTPWIAIAIVMLCGTNRRASLPWILATLGCLGFLVIVYARPEPHLEHSAWRTLMTPLLVFLGGALAAQRRAVTSSPT